MKTKATLGAAVLALVFGSGLAWAQGAPPPSGPADGPGPQVMVRSARVWQGGGPDGPMAMRPGGRGGWEGRGREGRGRDGRGFGRGGGYLHNPMIRQQLGVTADQTQKIEQQETETRKSEIRGRADLEIKRIELNQLLAADSPDRSAIDAKLQEVSTAQMALEKTGIDNRLAIQAILTPAQRKQLKDMRENGFRPPDGGQPGTRAQRGGRGPGGRGGAPPSGQQGQTPPAPPTNQ
jgi:Spy/CpxP family protein refolding chaperone